MSELSFYPEQGLEERAEIHVEDTAGRELTERVVGKVQYAVAPTRHASPHPRLTRGRHLDELEAVDESVDGHLRDLEWLTGQIQQIEQEVERLRRLYRRLIGVGAAAAGILILFLTIIVLVLVFRHH